MSETPPPYAAYPRNAPTYGTSRHLQSLSDGYFGLGKIFLINIALALGGNAIRIAVDPLIAVGYFLLLGVLVGFLTYGPNKKIGEGANWSPAQPVVASVLMGINSALCCGIIGYVVMQTIAANHIKKYGIKAGFFGLKKDAINATIGDLQARELNAGRI